MFPKSTAVILSARMGSSRLPGKSLMPIQGIPLISFCARRLMNNKNDIQIILATTDLKMDDPIEELAKHIGIECFRGDQNNLVKRYYDCATKYDLKYIIRATGDCPFINSELVDLCCDQIKEFDSATIYSTKKVFPVGLDLEFFSYEALENIQSNQDLTPEEKEHLTLHMYNNNEFQKKTFSFPYPIKYEGRDLTVDVKDDYQFAVEIAKLNSEINFSLTDVLKYALELQNEN
jgi:spore coat polysaccharide biosynthesis protein SpsF